MLDFRHFILLWLSASTYAFDLTEILSLKQGQVQGIWGMTTKGDPMRIYYGIPYAKPPIGDLRFEDPVPSEKWDDVLQAMTPSPLCPQFNLPLRLSRNIFNYMGQEDCLYLNVYTPRISPSNDLLPVMVYIHGGGYLVGSAIENEGHDLVDGGVILVSINYRLGALGFASTEDDRMSGNFGLKDQLLALRWVQENIEAFGGDKNKVTVFGHSAGGASAHILALSPKSKGLFQRAILQSGNALCPWALSESHLDDVETVSRNVGCSTPEGIDIDCLKRKDPFDILRPLENLIITGVGPIHFGPRVDGILIPADPSKLITANKYDNVDLMVGFAEDDGGFLTYGEFIFGYEEDRFSFNRSATLSLEHEPNYRELMEKVYDFYNAMDKKAKPEAVKEMISDRQFRLPSRKTAHLHSRTRTSNVYYYKYDHKGDRSFGLAFPKDFGTNWIQHGDELALLFPMAHMGGYPNRRKHDSDMSEKLVKIWTDFAKTGNPTPDHNQNFHWPRVEEQLPSNIVVLSSNLTIQDDSLSKPEEFWNSLCLKHSTISAPPNADREELWDVLISPMEESLEKKYK